MVDVAVLFTTDGNLATGDLVLLSDDRHLQPAENVVPVITDRAMALRETAGRRGECGLRAADLQGAAVPGLARRGSRGDVVAEAPGWLERHGIVSRPG